jgi:uncharacterized protein YgiM (DUF1202 family)
MPMTHAVPGNGRCPWVPKRGIYDRAVLRPVLLLTSLLLITACSTPPAPSGPPVAPAPPPSAAAAGEEATRTVYVTATALNVRSEASADAELVAQVKRGGALAVVEEREGWVNVRLEDGREGWVAERFVSSERVAQQTRRAAPARKKGGGGCESDYAFVETPTLGMTDRDAHGLVVVEATVNTKGVVTGTKVITNTTGDPGAGAVAEREIRSAKFAPPIRNCQPRSFIFTYRRTF